jgi:hypothetical protein
MLFELKKYAREKARKRRKIVHRCTRMHTDDFSFSYLCASVDNFSSFFPVSFAFIRGK